MAMNPSLFNPGVYQVNRGETPPPGSPLPDPSQTYPYVRVPDGQGGWIYYRADDARARGGRMQQPGAQLVNLPTNVVSDGYHEDANGQAVSDQAPSSHPGLPDTTSPRPPVAPAPAPTGAPVVNNGPPAGTGGSANSSDPASRGLYIDGDQAQPTQPAQGRWIRNDGYADPTKGGDQLGVDLVREDSPAGKAWIAAHPGQQPIYVQTGFKTVATGGAAQIDVPEALAGSQAFQGLIRQFPTMGSNLLDAKEVPVPTEAGTGYSKAYSVTWLTPNGAKQTITFGVNSGDSSTGTGTSTHVGVIGSSLETSGMKTPDQEALTRAQTKQAEAGAALDDARRTGQGIDDAIKAKAQADRDLNNAAGLGNVTTVEASENGLRSAQTTNTVAQTANTAQQTASTAQGTVNQTYTNILQYYRDQGVDEGKAIELTQQYFNNKALVDNNNNTTALGAARAQTDAETAANTQRVSLANNRLSQSSQGFTEDAKTADDINQYLKPGSSKGGDAFMALQAMRMANAKKYGSFDVNDSDLKFDPTHLPNGIRAFADPAHPSFVTYPDLPSMRNEAQTTGDRMGIHNRPAPPGLDTIPKPVVPAAAPAPASAPNTGRPVAPAAAPGARPATTATPATQQRAAQTGQNTPAEGQEQPTDIITVYDPRTNRTTAITRATWDGIDPETRAYLQVKDAHAGSTVEQPTQSQVTDPRVNGATGDATVSQSYPSGTSTPQSNEQPTDILTLTSHRETDGQPSTRQISRAEWDQQLAAYPELKASYDKGEITVDNAESGDNYVRLDNGSYVRKPSQGSSDAGANDALKISLNQSTNDAVMAKTEPEAMPNGTVPGPNLGRTMGTETISSPQNLGRTMGMETIPNQGTTPSEVDTQPSIFEPYTQWNLPANQRNMPVKGPIIREEKGPLDDTQYRQPLTGQATDQQPTQMDRFLTPGTNTPSRPMTAEEMARAQQVMAQYGQTPKTPDTYYQTSAAVNQLTGPSPALASTNAALGDPNLELQRQRQRALAQMFGSPDSIYGLMDGAYPQYPSFYS